MAKQVIVHDVDALQGYCRKLAELKQEVLDGSRDLNELSNQLKVKSEDMHNITEHQANNWRDPQYDTMKNAVTPCMVALSINANTMNETAAYINEQMGRVEESLDYLRSLIRKLKS